MNELTGTLQIVVAFAATYLLHSTLLLVTCGLFLHFSRNASHFLAERLWKLAAVMGLFTAVIQITCGSHLSPSWNLTQVHSVARTSAAETSEVAEDIGASPSDQNDPLPRLDTALVDASRRHTASLHPIDAVGIAPTARSATSSGPGITRKMDSAGSPAEITWTRSPTDVDRAIVASAGEFADTALPARDIAEAVTSGPSTFESSRVAPTKGSRLLSPWFGWLSALTSVLVIGCVIIGGVSLAAQSWRMHARFATSRPHDEGPARQALDRFLKRHKIRRQVRLLSSTTQHEPVTYGLFVWTIVLPIQTEVRLGKEELQALLAHEVAHLVRGDVGWLWVGQFICHCLAFQPLNFLARRKWQQAAEYLSDDWAVEHGVRSLALARCLTQIAEWRFGRPESTVGLAAAGTKATLVERVERLVNTGTPQDAWSKPPRRRVLVIGACVMAMTLVCLTPRLAVPFVSAARTNLDEVPRVAGRGEDVEQIQAEWHLLREELLQLEAELAEARRTFPATSAAPEAAHIMAELNRRAVALGARRTKLTSFFGKDSRR